MADIFISYAHEDRERIEPLARALQADGYDVWWDRETEAGLKPGDDFDIVIEEQLETAACVIVGWSATSRKSRYVRDEARDALDRGVLVPVFLEAVKPPLGFRSLHTEDFGTWQDDLQAENWQRLVLQTAALKEAARPDEALTADAPATSPEPAPVSAAPPPKPGFKASVPFVGTAVPLMAAAWFLSSGPQLGVMGLTVMLALLSFLLFRQADLDLHPHMKALASRWLLPVEGKAEVNTPEAFLRLFEAVFGPRHLSFYCFRRSALASMLGLIVMITIFNYFKTEVRFVDILFMTTSFETMKEVLFLLVVVNILGDYLSLWETRFLLNIAVRRPSVLLLFILLDALLTIIVILVGVLFVVIFFQLIDGVIPSLAYIGNKIMIYIENTSQDLISITGNPYNSLTGLVFGVTAATSFITSIWLWLAVLGAPLARLLVWSRTSGLSTLGRFIDTENRPFTALGLLTALFILLIGTVIWGLGFLWGS